MCAKRSDGWLCDSTGNLAGSCRKISATNGCLSQLWQDERVKGVQIKQRKRDEGESEGESHQACTPRP